MQRIFLFIALFSLFSHAAYAEDKVVATVNGTKITARDVEVELERLIPRATFHGGVKPEARTQLRGKALENLIVERLQYLDAVERGLKPDKKQVKTRMKQIRDKFDSKSKYQEALTQAGVTEDELRGRIELEALVQTVTEKTVNEPARMSDAAVKEYYDNNVAKFKQPETVKLKRISAKDKKKINEAFSRIKSGQDFSAIAATMSEDDYRVKGGDMGFIHRGRLALPEIEKEAFRLKPGEMSRPMLADGTWYIVKVEDKKPERQVTFDEIKGKLKATLETQRSSELMEQWMGGLRAKAKIEKFEKESGQK